MVKEQMLRVYYDLEASDPELRRLCELACHNPSIDLCHVRDNPASGDISSIFAMIWRLLVLVVVVVTGVCNIWSSFGVFTLFFYHFNLPHYISFPKVSMSKSRNSRNE